jgi:polyisoprenoid-binding protein YceI
LSEIAPNWKASSAIKADTTRRGDAFHAPLTLKLTIAREIPHTARMKYFLLFLVAIALFPAPARAQAPVVEVVPEGSHIKFNVKASVALAGKFDKWDASLVFTSPDETTGVLTINIEADSVDTGSGMKNGKLKNKDFFDVANYPTITFKSTKVVKVAPLTYEVDGDFTIRGVSNPEKLRLTVTNKGGGEGAIIGTMNFNRKDYGMNKGIPFIKIADHVDVSFHLNLKHTGGPTFALN